jgi:hypothetical protein
LQEDFDSGLVCSGNFMKYLADNILEEQELLCSVVNKMNTLANELDIPLIKIVTSCREAYVKMMKSNMVFDSDVQKLLA